MTPPGAVRHKALARAPCLPAAQGTPRSGLPHPLHRQEGASGKEPGARSPNSRSWGAFPEAAVSLSGPEKAVGRIWTPSRAPLLASGRGRSESTQPGGHSESPSPRVGLCLCPRSVCTVTGGLALGPPLATWPQAPGTPPFSRSPVRRRLWPGAVPVGFSHCSPQGTARFRLASQLNLSFSLGAKSYFVIFHRSLPPSPAPRGSCLTLPGLLGGHSTSQIRSLCKFH